MTGPADSKLPYVSTKPEVYQPKKSFEYMENLYRTNFKKEPFTHKVQAVVAPKDWKESAGIYKDRYKVTTDRVEYKVPNNARNLLVDYRLDEQPPNTTPFSVRPHCTRSMSAYRNPATDRSYMHREDSRIMEVTFNVVSMRPPDPFFKQSRCSVENSTGH